MIGATLLTPVPFPPSSSLFLQEEPGKGPEEPSILAPIGLPGEQAAAAPPTPLPAADRWFLMNRLQGTWMGVGLDDHRLQFYGWTEMSFTGSSTKISNLPVVWNDRANQFLLQQHWTRFERPVVTSGTTEPTFGFRLDFLAGSDYRFTLIRDLFNDQLLNSKGNQNIYGVDPAEFYVNAYVPTLFRGTEFRVGRFYNPWGVESLEAISTPLMSRTYCFNNTPFTLMGVGAYPIFNSRWSGAFVLANGNDTFLGPADAARFFGSLTWKLPTNRDTLSLNTSVGRGMFNSGLPFNPATNGLASEPAGHNNYNAFDIIWNHTFNPAFSYTMESCYVYQNGVPANVPGGIIRPGAVNGTAHWAMIVNYFKYTFNRRWSTIIRAEAFDDIDGQRTGFLGLYTALTVGIQYRPTRYLILRPEIRYDHNGESRAFENHHGILTAGGDLIVRW